MNFNEMTDKITDSRNTSVGGGSASAVAASMGAGLVGMVARLSVAKNGKSYGLSDEEYLACAEELGQLTEELKKGAVRDAEAFQNLKNAFALPRGTAEEKAARGEAVENAAVRAATVPLENARLADRVLELAEELDGKSNPALGSDLFCGKKLAIDGVCCAILNAIANLPLIETPEREEILIKALRAVNEKIRKELLIKDLLETVEKLPLEDQEKISDIAMEMAHTKG